MSYAEFFTQHVERQPVLFTDTMLRLTLRFLYYYNSLFVYTVDSRYLELAYLE